MNKLSKYSIPFKTVLSGLVVSIAMVAAQSSSAMCLWFVFGQPKMPKSLVK